MSKVIMSLECGCFRKSGMKNNKSFDSKEMALEEAIKMTDNMNETFCQKHNFTVVENGDDVLIEVKSNN